MELQGKLQCRATQVIKFAHKDKRYGQKYNSPTCWRKKFPRRKRVPNAQCSLRRRCQSKEGNGLGTEGKEIMQIWHPHWKREPYKETKRARSADSFMRPGLRNFQASYVGALIVQKGKEGTRETNTAIHHVPPPSSLPSHFLPWIGGLNMTSLLRMEQTCIG